MDMVMTFEEIERNFESEWVLVKDPVVDKNFRVIKGEVICHSKDRDEIDRKAVELRLRSSAFLYTGKTPKYAALNL